MLLFKVPFVIVKKEFRLVTITCLITNVCSCSIAHWTIKMRRENDVGDKKTVLVSSIVLPTNETIT